MHSDKHEHYTDKDVRRVVECLESLRDGEVTTFEELATFTRVNPSGVKAAVYSKDVEPALASVVFEGKAGEGAYKAENTDPNLGDTPRSELLHSRGVRNYVAEDGILTVENATTVTTEDLAERVPDAR